MEKFLIVDSRVARYQDLKNRIMINDDLESDVTAYLYTNNDDMQNEIINGGYTGVVLASNVVEREDFVIPIKVNLYGFLEKNSTSPEALENNHIKNIGVFTKTSDLLTYLETLDSTDNATNEVITKEEVPVEEKPPASSVPDEERNKVIPSAEDISDNIKENDDFAFCTNCGAKIIKTVKFCPECGAKMGTKNVTDIMRDTANEMDGDISKIETQVEADIRPTKHKCKIIATYAAKGGVGKTTIATSLATYLAMTCTDRRQTKVCIVDYNIDFGDVRPTIGFSSDGPTMMMWASDIDARISEGEDKENINYTQEEIETKYLQKKTFKKLVYGHSIEVYGLLAPVSHADSMLISDNALKIMLDNLKNNGDFDYIICDTGNNTRDSSYIALDKADNVFLINTQDVTTVSCNTSFLDTMDKIQFAKDKISLIVNNIVPAKETGISVRDIEETVPFPCVARIRHNTNVILANNKGEPIVFNENAQLTKEMSNIVAAITDETLIVQAKKKSVFNFLRKKKSGKGESQ